MKRKRKEDTNNIHNIINNDEYDDNSTTRLASTAASSNDNNLTASASNNSPAPSSNIINSISISSISKTVTRRKILSSVWMYATKSDDGASASCQLCEYTCTISSHSTSTIRYHLIHKHKKLELIINSSSSHTPKISEKLKQELHDLCYNAIIVDHRPFNDLRKQGLMDIFNKLCPGYTPPHRNQISNNLKNLYDDHFKILKNELKEIDYIGLTFDFWTSNRSVSFLCITGHWFKDKMQYVSKIIHFSSFNARHTGKNIANSIKEVLINLDIYYKIIAITCDGAENVISACNQLDGFFKRIWCCAHRLHLVVVNSLGFWNKEHKNDSNMINHSTTEPTTSATTFDSTISSNQDESMDTDDMLADQIIDDASDNHSAMVDTLVSDQRSEEENIMVIDNEIIDGSENIHLIEDSWSIDIDHNIPVTNEIEIIMDLLKKCRSIATSSKKSLIIAHFIRTNQILLELKKTINNDCKSRWNSTYVLIDTLLELKPIIIKLFYEKRHLNLQKDQIEKLTKIELTNHDWDFLDSLRLVLKPFFLGTNMMSGKYYPSIGLAYHAVHKIKEFCTNERNSNNHIKELKRLILIKLYKYFYDDVEQFQYFQYHAFFDPSAHLSLTDVEKQQCERYIKKLIFEDTYPQKCLPGDSSKISSSVVSTATSATTSAASQYAGSTSKSSVYSQFIEACGDPDVLMEKNKDKSKRIILNEEMKYFRAVVQEYNLKNEPSTTSAIDFWQIHYIRLPLLSHLAKVHLAACGTSVPSESAFSTSAHIARKERSRLSPDNLSYTVFLKDKLAKR